MIKLSIKATSIFSVALILSACSSMFFGANQKRIFILGEMPQTECEKPLENFRVTETESANFYLNNKIWFQNGAELGFYQFSEWSEALNHRLARLIKEQTRCLNLQPEDLQLRFTIMDFVHDISQQPGVLKVNLRLQLYSGENSIKQQSFKYEQELENYDVTGLVKASNLVVDSFLMQLAGFLE